MADAPCPLQAAILAHGSSFCPEEASWGQVYDMLNSLINSDKSASEQDDDEAASDVKSVASGADRAPSEGGALVETSFEDSISIASDDAVRLEGASTDDTADRGDSGASRPGGLVEDFALALQRELLRAFRQPLFQDKLRDLLWEFGGPSAAQHLEGRSELCLSAVRADLLSYGFEDTPAGLWHAYSVLEALAADSEELTDGQEAIYSTLGITLPLLRDEAFGARPSVPWSI